MNELTILMAWHNESCLDKIKVYEANKQSFLTYNPNIEIVTIINPYKDLRDAWLSTDLSIFKWYIDNGERNRSERYLIVEWDCWCDCLLKDYYSRVWDLDLIVPNGNIQILMIGAGFLLLGIYQKGHRNSQLE